MGVNMGTKKRYSSKIKGIDAARVGITFGDLLLLPGYSEVLPNQVDVSTHLGEIKLGIPLISAAMDTVSEKEFAAAIAREGGLAIIHKNLSIEGRVEHIQWVKRSESGMIYAPLTLPPNASVGEVKRIMEEKGISGIPIVDDKKKVLGIVTKRDVKYCKDMHQPVHERMTERERLVVLPYMADWSPEQYGTEAEKLMAGRRVEKIPVVRTDFTLEGLITQADVDKVREFPNACRDDRGRLRAGVAVGNSDEEIDGVGALLEAGADVICVDSAHGHSAGIINATERIRKKYGHGFVLISGNVGTYAGARSLIDAGADVVKVGIGPGSICTTRIVSGVGVPQITAVDECMRAIHNSGRKVSLIADGGIEYSGDITKALAIADTVMIGGLFAGVAEAPGKMEIVNGIRYKVYRGMGSASAMQERGSRERYRQADVKDPEKLVPEGVETRVPYTGPLSKQVHQLVGGLRAGMGYVGAKTIEELHRNGKFIMVSPGAIRESHVHGVALGATASNYRG